ncbi:GerAB/ArcD/ProY family transporter [Brevibacillus dissolubilis]|uniref:GerAB/ArcD/ProY family transporter n=1 Tax=Brevibacillus dissolubilis TaxID=1844116 RepID=UPI00159BE9E7|nr:endospore germination permease [Brevibacillus dissolubilis]
MHILSAGQLWSLILLFQVGSNIVFGFGAGAKQDAWIAAGISTILGAALIYLYSKIYEWYPRHTWSTLLVHLFGRVIGRTLAIIYIFSFIYVAGRVMRDFGELLKTYMLPQTPTGLTMFLFLLVILYACYAGLERMGRLAEVSIFFILGLLTLQFLFLLSSDVLDFVWMYPMGEDWRAIMATVFPLGVSVPFGETLVFAMFWSVTVNPKSFRRSALLSTCMVGLLFIVLDVTAISTIGPYLFSRTLYPMFTMFQMTSVADFLDNLDPFVVINLLIAGMFKIFIFTYGACVGIANLFRLSDYRVTIAPIGVLIWLLAAYMTKNISSHVFVGLQWVPWVMWVPLFMLIPLVVGVVAWFKKKHAAGEEDVPHERSKTIHPS